MTLSLLNGRRVAVTGGTSGLGLALVRELHRRGAAVAFVARTADRVHAVSADVDGTYGIVGDVSRKEDIYPIAMQITAALGGLDVLVNNASSLGPVPLVPLADTDCEDLEAALATNVVGPFRLTRALLGALAASAREARAPLILNISSDAAETPYPNWGAYGVSKAALRHLTRIWREELVGLGIDAVAVDPGDMDTPMHALAVPDADRAALKRPADAAVEIAELIEARAARDRWRARACRQPGGVAMTAASGPRSAAARLLVVGNDGRIVHLRARDLPDLVRAGDVVVANDAATLPASLTGEHEPTAAAIEVRLAGRRSLAWQRVRRFVAVAFGAGDHRTPTEQRPPPPPLHAGDRLRLGPLAAVVERVLGHPRLIELAFDGSLEDIWSGIARHGRPIQYAHVPQPLAMWSTWTRIASLPVAFEPPSAGFVLDWATVQRLRDRGAALATLTHAAGISSTGDTALDALLPLDEPYRIPAATAAAIDAARIAGGRVIAIGTTVVRALEHAALPLGRVRAGDGIATGRIGPGTRLRIADAIVSGTHEPGTSHYELLRAFQDDATLWAMASELEAHAYQTHEFGDFVWLTRAVAACRRSA